MGLTLYDSSYYIWKCSSSNKSVAVFSCGFAHAFNYIFVWEKLTFEHLLLITFILRGCIILSTCLILCLLHFNWINQNWINIRLQNLLELAKTVSWILQNAYELLWVNRTLNICLAIHSFLVSLPVMPFQCLITFPIFNSQNEFWFRIITLLTIHVSLVGIDFEKIWYCKIFLQIKSSSL